MDDLISRQAAIEAMTDKNIVENMDSVIDTELHRCKRAVHRIIAKIPSPLKHGKWNKIKENSWACSECKKENCYAFHYNDDLTGLILQDFFCPNCGARMEGGENATD